MSSNPPDLSSQVFLLRLWTELQGDGQTAWCGKIQHLMGDEAYRFGNWADLVAWLQTTLPDVSQPDHTQAGDSFIAPTGESK